MQSDSHPNLEEIKKLPPEEAIALLNALLEKDKENDLLLTLRGQTFWKLNKRREAINDYLCAIKINPESHSKVLLEYAQTILAYYNKDLLNP
ncbi:MAG: hypothetical protein J1F16_08365 [Muribaculaceae bacterium]|nr:hypothetical protein [Muribaculaceae bacterium]